MHLWNALYLTEPSRLPVVKGFSPGKSQNITYAERQKTQTALLFDILWWK